MKWLSILYLGTIAIYAQAQPLSSAIKEVTVYNDRAAITRYAEIELGSGEHDLTFENLPVGLDDRSLQVEVTGDTPVTLLDISSTFHYVANEEQLTKDAQQIKVLKANLVKKENQLAVISNQAEFTEQIRDSILSEDEKANRPSAEEAKEVVLFFTSMQEQLLTQQRQLNNEKQLLVRSLSVLQQKAYEARHQEKTRTKQVRVNVRVPKAETVKLALTYMVSDAGWYPTYDARFDSKDQKLSLSYLGNVFQETGEDWRKVKLTLSTAQPMRGGVMPTLSAWVLKPYVPIATMGNDKREMLSETSRYYAAPLYQEAASSVMEKKQVVAKKPRARVLQSLTNASFILNEPTTLVSSEDVQKVSINSLDDLKTSLVYQVIPRLTPRAFLEARTKNNTAYPLLEGELNVFVDGRFVAKNKLNTIMPEQDFSVNLGTDDALKVTYKELKRFSEKTGFTNSGERVTYDYLMTLQNNSNRLANVNIKDQIPVSQNEKIKVKLLTPSNIKADKEGVLDWQVTIKPAEQLTIPVKFAVDYPVNTTIIGL